MYNLKVMTYVFYNLYNITETEAWTRALNHMIFGPYVYMKRIEENFDNDIISPCWCLDDAGVHFTGMMFFIDPHMYGIVQGSFDTLRTVTNALLINCPYKEKLMGGLKQYDDREITLYIGDGHGGADYNRKGVCIKWYRLPNGKKHYYKDFEDIFSCYVPKWIYDKYIEKRRHYNKLISDKWKKRMKEQNIV